MKNERIEKMKTLRLIYLAMERLKTIEKLVKDSAYIQAEAETHVVHDIIELLLLTIKRLENT